VDAAYYILALFQLSDNGLDNFTLHNLLHCLGICQRHVLRCLVNLA